MHPIRIAATLIIVFVALGFAAAADPKAAPANAGQAADLQGTWKLIAIAKDGKAQPAKPGDQDYFTLIIAGDKMTVQFPGAAEEGKFKVDVVNKVHTIDIFPATSEDKGKTILGIYEVQGDKLQLCVAEAGVKDRPKAFKAKKDQVTVYHLVKEKKP